MSASFDIPVLDQNHSMRHGMEWKAPRRGGHRPPWFDQDGNVIWSPFRIRVSKIIDHNFFEGFMSMLIAVNVCMIVLETDAEASCYPAYSSENLDDCPTSGGKSHPWLMPTNYILLVIYTMEAGLRLYVDRWMYHKNKWNLLDGFVVITGWVTVMISFAVRLSFLRFLRIARLARLLRIFIAVRELYMLFSGLVSAMRTIFWGTILLFGMLLLWAIVVVELLHPINVNLVYNGCDRCARGYASVFATVVTLFQTIVAGDSWGMIAVPVIDTEPWTGIFLVGALVTVSLGLTNLILAVIVERAADAREKDMQERVRQKREDEEQQKRMLLKMCQAMDLDESGTVCLRELMEAYDNLPEFKAILKLMDIGRDELKSVIRVLDTDGSGDVSYREFCDQLHQIRTRDTRTMLTFIKLACSEIAQAVDTAQRDFLTPLLHQSQDHNNELRLHSDILRTLQDKSMSDRAPAECHAPVAPARGGGGWRSAPVAPPPPPPELPLSAENLIAEFRSLGSHADELAGLENAIVRRVEEQMATLTKQAQTLVSLGLGVSSGTKQFRVDRLGDVHAARVGEKLARLHENLHQELEGLVRDVDSRLEDGAATLARNHELLASLSSDLGCFENASVTQELPSECKAVSERKSAVGPSAALARARTADPAAHVPSHTVCGYVGRHGPPSRI